MSIKVMSRVWDSGLRSDLKLVALALADFANDEGSDIFPAVSRLAKKVSKTDRAVQYSLRELEELGVVAVVERGGGSHKNTTEYRFNLASLLTGETDGVSGESVAPVTGEVDGRTGAIERSTGATDFTQQVQPIAPNPSSDPSDRSVIRERARASPSKKRERHRELTEADVTEMADTFLTVDVWREYQKFQDYLLAKQPKYVDYVAAFRNWLRRCEDDEPKRERTPGRSDQTRQLTSDEAATIDRLYRGAPVFVMDPPGYSGGAVGDDPPVHQEGLETG